MKVNALNKCLVNAQTREHGLPCSPDVTESQLSFLHITVR